MKKNNRLTLKTETVRILVDRLRDIRGGILCPDTAVSCPTDCHDCMR